MGAGGSGLQLVGITGGMGSGKSRVSCFWAAYAGLPRIDIDAVCRQLVEPGEPGWCGLRTLLPGSFFTVRGDLDRRLLRVALFADPELRAEVNRLLHPLAREGMRLRAGHLKGPLVLVDVPLLYEAGWHELFARCVVVYADQETRCRRLAARDQISPEEAVRSMAAQMPLWAKALLADHVIDNRGCWLLARQQVTHLARLLAADIPGAAFLQESP